MKILLMLLIIMTLFVRVPSIADVGGIQRYDSGSSSSYSSSSSSSSSWGGSSSSYRSSSSSSGGSYSGSSSPFSVIIFIIIIIVYVAIKSRARNKGTMQNFATNIQSMDNTTDVANRIREIDPAFSEDNFLSWANEVFIKLQQAWTNKEWNKIRPFESNELFEQHNAQLNEFIRAGKTNIVERINVKDSSLYSFTQDGDKETLKVTLSAVMRDYIIEDSTKKVLEGDPNRDMHMTYRLTFIRKAGVKTKEGDSKHSTTNCPNCGAPTQVTSSGQCEYCRSIITTGEHDWVLSNLEGVR